MPIFNCSGCGTLLNAPDKLAGRKCKCTKCATVLLIPAPKQQADESVTEQPPKKKIVPASIATAPAKLKKPVADDGEEPNDAPNGDDDEKKPKKRKGKANETKVAGSNKGLILIGAAAAVGLLFVMLLAAGLGVWWWRSHSSSPTASNSNPTSPSTPAKAAGPSDFYFLPNSVVTIQSIHVDEMRHNQFYKELSAAQGGDKEDLSLNFGIKETNVERMVFAFSQSTESLETVTIVKTKAAVQPNEIIATFKQAFIKLGIPQAMAEYTESKVGKYTMYELKVPPGAFSFGQAFCVADDRTVVLSQSKPLRSVLERDKEPEFSPGMQALLKKADFTKASTSVKDFSNSREKQLFDGLFFLPGLAGGLEPGKGVQMESQIEEQQATTDFMMKQISTFKDAAAAAQVKKEWDDSYQKAKDNPIIKEATAEFQVNATVSGNSLIVEGKISSKLFVKLLSNLKPPQP